jgi:nickel/cobalt exporter
MKRLHLLPFSTAVALGAFSPTQASAHLVNTDVGEFYAGMLHPLTSAEHLLPTLALALLASQCGKGAARTALFAFPLALLVGTLAGSRLPPFAFLHVVNLVALVAWGGLLALRHRFNGIHLVAVGALALLTGSILGYRSGMDMVASKVAAQFIPGVALTGFIVVALVVSWVPGALSRPGRRLRTLVGASFAVTGMVLSMQLLTATALPAARGTWMPGQEDVLSMLRAGELSLPLVIGTLVAVMVWGAGHALTPGHGKTMVAAYLIGSRSTPWHALYLGLTVTLTHTLGVFALGLVALFASHYILPEQLYPWLGAVSGLVVVGLGAAMLWKRVQPPLARWGHAHHHRSHDHGHDHPPEHAHPHGRGHPHAHEHHHTHDQGHGHTHLPPGADGSTVSWRSLLGLASPGGSCPARRPSSCSSRPCPATGSPWGWSWWSPSASGSREC